MVKKDSLRLLLIRTVVITIVPIFREVLFNNFEKQKVENMDQASLLSPFFTS